MMSAFRMWFKSILGLLHTHVALLQLDIQEEKEQLAHLGLLLVALCVCSGLALIMLTIWVGIIFWPYSPFYTAFALTLLYASLALFFFWRIRSSLKRAVPFASTLAELKKSKETLF